MRGKHFAEIVQSEGLFVLPSCLEGQQLALLEAMQESLSVLASDIPTHQKLIGDDR